MLLGFEELRYPIAKGLSGSAPPRLREGLHCSLEKLRVLLAESRFTLVSNASCKLTSLIPRRHTFFTLTSKETGPFAPPPPPPDGSCNLALCLTLKFSDLFISVRSRSFFLSWGLGGEPPAFGGDWKFVGWLSRPRTCSVGTRSSDSSASSLLRIVLLMHQTSSSS